MRGRVRQRKKGRNKCRKVEGTKERKEGWRKDLGGNVGETAACKKRE
jgi:hypothetical protein